MSQLEYRVSFSTGGLFYSEAVKAATLYLELQDWSAVRQDILEHNRLQARTRATTSRILRELLPRLRLLSPAQLQILVEGFSEEQKQILWFATCQYYRLIHEFAVEVVREKWLRLDLNLDRTDFYAFLNARADWHPEVGKLTTSTRAKLGRVLFQMLREAELISTQHQIIPTDLSPRVRDSILGQAGATLAIFPMPDPILTRQAGA